MAFLYLQESGLNEEQLRAFERFREMLIHANQTMNLTAITEPVEVEIKHFLDSLLIQKCGLWKKSIVSCNKKPGGLKVADVGAGAGFPGIPLRILYEEIRLDVFEATEKRVLFMRELAQDIGLDPLRIFHMRAEDAGRDPEFRAHYDWVLSRGVASMPALLEMCLPLVKTGGYFAAYKGPSGEKEAQEWKAAAAILGGMLVETVQCELPEKQGERRIIIYQKVAPTPKGYPRKAGIPTKQPLTSKPA